MKLHSLVVLSALALSAASYAKADTISITGSDTYTTTGAPVTGFDITFDPLANVGGKSTGIFSAFTGCYQCVTMTSSLVYNEGTTFTPTELFSVNENGKTATATLTSINSISGDLVFNGNATFVIDGTTYYGTLDFTTQAGGQGVNDVTFSATSIASPVPEPASLALLGTGLLGAVGAIRRKYSV